jgi:hypothetical protein
VNDLQRACFTAFSLSEKVASAATCPDDLREKSALAAFAAFGMFKQAALNLNANDIARPLAWGLGVGLPVLGVGKYLISDAADKAKQTVDRTALMASLGAPLIAGTGHFLLADARRQGERLIEKARNEALLAGAGIKGVQAIGEVLKARAQRPEMPAYLPEPSPGPAMTAESQPFSLEHKLAAAVLVDDILEEVCAAPDHDVKHAALVDLIRHRNDSIALLRAWLP